MTAARIDAAFPAVPTPVVGEWPVSPRFFVAPPAPVAVVAPLPPEPQAAAAPPEDPTPPAEPGAELPPLPEEPLVAGAPPVATLPLLLPELAIEPAPPVPHAPAPELPEALADAPAIAVEPAMPEARAMPEAPVMPEAPGMADEPAMADTPVIADAPNTLDAPHAPALQAVPDLPPVAPVMPEPPIMPAAPAVAGDVIVALPQLPVIPEANVGPWPVDRPADLRPDTARGRLPHLPTSSRQLLLVAALAGLGGFLVLRGIGGDDASTPPAGAPAAAVAPANWTAKMPRVVATGDVDALTLDVRELRPARTRHQLELAIEAMKPGEVIRDLTVRSDGTLMLTVLHGSDERYVVTKGIAPAPPAAAPSTGTPAPILAIDPIEIDARTPRKLLKIVTAAKGAPPSSMKLIRSAQIQGGQPTWLLQWNGADGKPTTTIYATSDASKLASTPAGL